MKSLSLALLLREGRGGERKAPPICRGDRAPSRTPISKNLKPSFTLRGLCHAEAQVPVAVPGPKDPQPGWAAK